MKKKYIIILIIVSAALLTYFLLPDARKKTSPKVSSTKTVKFTKEGTLSFISGKSQDTISIIYIELAKDLYEQARGLMYRYEMPSDMGMLFAYKDMDHRSFWMKNTHIPLDIIFIDEQMKIVHIHEYAIPYSEDLIPSTKPAQYIVEVNAGYTSEMGIKSGDIISYSLFK
jgi:uncharacterized membrane protein (UPF0127 family)